MCLRRRGTRRGTASSWPPSACSTVDRPSRHGRWGRPGQCAVMTPGWPVVLADLREGPVPRAGRGERKARVPRRSRSRPHCEVVRGARYGARAQVPRPSSSANPCLERETRISGGVCATAQQVTAADAQLFADWTIAFMGEATPHDPQPLRDRLTKVAGEGRHLFWIVDGEPVAMAGIARRTRNCAAISGVYTPPSQRGRGYAGSVTAALVERVFAEGRAAVCLYTDLRNPFSDRCYAKIGFKPLCASWHFPRDMSQG